MSQKTKSAYQQQLESEGWKPVGVIGVDAGLCWLGDPCYCVTPDATSHPAKDWPSFCKMLDKNKYPNAMQFNYAKGHPGLGVVVSTGFGDGCYQVYVRETDEGEWGKRIAEVRVVFIEPDCDEEGEE